ncbi:UTP--glucose-1-phosphate uridylyltransferase [Gracilariopsis chorda]|uniref:UTP--glucose-1-phosphate uridylyltransferase n=1 Tax=Gracilariopsis chorda TaxID=448386 RepID=A0A2V3IJG9_9FLOR|nr:UTP--glucose-1-phosphate uridylyltransferase [Gracilariopsis chorda]|eukprot:PXF42245.1 UTP--glucose-1-phosphate uridylyltransferase [Gracilariopsis chorda]
MPALNLFVPGRLCLAGEHSDWAATYVGRSVHVTPGAALVVALQQGLYAQVAPSPFLSLTSPLASHIELAPGQLLENARSDSPWRYASAVAHLIHQRFRIPRAVSIIIHSETLLPSKGLSSSAAVCVLVARAYNRIYQLALTEEGEMELAYQGERLTGSACGRMDQIVAITSGRVACMHFDGDYVSHTVLPPPAKPIYIVVAQVGVKDTATILTALHRAYPNADTEQKQRLQHALGANNLRLIKEMQRALADGDPCALGLLMTTAQRCFDHAAIPFCPEQLTSPKLHCILKDPDVLPLVYGGKGVGSQGDGAVQFVAKSKEKAHLLCKMLMAKLSTQSFVVTVGTEPEQHSHSTATQTESIDNTIRTAVIPAAGFGTRLFPASRIIRPKALFPVVDTDGFVKPLLLHLTEQCSQASLSKAVIVVSPGEQQQRVRDLFSPVPKDLYAALKPHMREYADRIRALGEIVEIAIQREPRGFGHAVSCAPLKSGEPFLLLLGDVVFQSEKSAPSCLQQVLNAFRETTSTSVIGVTQVPVSEAGAYGVVKTVEELTNERRRCRIESIVEKPSAEEAEKLSSEGMCSIVLGPYAFTPSFWEALERDIAEEKTLNGEIQLTPSMCSLLEVEGMDALLLEGHSYDTGNATDYRRTFGAFGV